MKLYLACLALYVVLIVYFSLRDPGAYPGMLGYVTARSEAQTLRNSRLEATDANPVSVRATEIYRELTAEGKSSKYRQVGSFFDDPFDGLDALLAKNWPDHGRRCDSVSPVGFSEPNPTRS